MVYFLSPLLKRWCQKIYISKTRTYFKTNYRISKEQMCINIKCKQEWFWRMIIQNFFLIKCYSGQLYSQDTLLISIQIHYYGIRSWMVHGKQILNILMDWGVTQISWWQSMINDLQAKVTAVVLFPWWPEVFGLTWQLPSSLAPQSQKKEPYLA